MVFKIPYSGVGIKYSESEKQAVLHAMDVITTLTQGTYQQQFQQDFSNFVNMSYAFATSCCATALELAAILLKLKSGDEVICPAHTYCASVYPFARHGVKIKWADIDRDTLVVSADTIAPLITKKTKLIIAVHLYGLPAQMPEIMQLAKQHNIPVLEDCAQSIGATIDGKRAGSFGDISVFSFQSHKNITTLGEGGMICFNHPEWAKVLPGLRHNGHRPYGGLREQYWHPAMVNVDFDEGYENIWPHNFCLGEPQCALGIELLKRVDSLRIDRRNRHNQFIEAMKGCPELIFQTIPEKYQSAHHLLPFRYDGRKQGKNSYDFIDYIARVQGVQAIVQYYPLNRYPLFSKMGYGDARIPNTNLFFDNMVSLPFHCWMSEDDFDYMIEATKNTVLALREMAKVVVSA